MISKYSSLSQDDNVINSLSLKVKLREAVSYDELQGQDTSFGPKLSLKNTQVYAQGPTVPMQVSDNNSRYVTK